MNNTKNFGSIIQKIKTQWMNVSQLIVKIYFIHVHFFLVEERFSLKPLLKYKNQIILLKKVNT